MAKKIGKSSEPELSKADGIEIESPLAEQPQPGTESETIRPGVELSEPDNKRELEQLKIEVQEAFHEENVGTAHVEENILMGDFKGAQLTDTGKIKFSPEEEKDAGRQIAAHKSKFLLSAPSVFQGSLTATEYGSKARNFSTRTKIIELEDGKKVFAVYNYPLSSVHRFLDGMFKHLAGDRMGKAASGDWKKTFEARSNVPTIECEDPRVVMMPYLPNINAHDLFANNHKIKDFGECSWAEGTTTEDKLEFGDQIIQELERVHKTGKCWGETILPNIIITAEKQVVIVDPETQYDKDVPEAEQKARDLRDIIMSICGALHKSEPKDVGNYQAVVKRLMGQYSDKSVLQETKKLAAQKPTFIQSIFRVLHDSARLGISPAEYKKVSEAILEG